MVRVNSVEKNSPAEKKGILCGDYLISINGNDINDVLDYRFYLAEKKITLKIHREAELFDITIIKDEYEDIGLDFETYLMDSQHSCRNKCIFCFIDQLPQGMRESLYFKDDDSRMSFLMGSYITLTNLGDADINRIVRMKTSPINISIHTTERELRNKMLCNRFAGESLKALEKFSDAGIKINAQIVLCKGVNDGEHLDRTLSDLEKYYPSLQSCSIVPCGITKHRDGLYPLEPFSPDECKAVIAKVSKISDRMREKYGVGLFYLADEFFIKSGMPIPEPDYYDGYLQIENGVGLIASMKEEFFSELKYLDTYDLKRQRDISIATGEAAYGFISMLAETLCKRVPNLKITVHKIINNFFGENITVAGLIVGNDLKSQLKDRHLGEKLYIPSVMLRYEKDVFLDDVGIKELSDFLGVEIETVENDGFDFIERILS